jgi:hypothetical protein
MRKLLFLFIALIPLSGLQAQREYLPTAEDLEAFRTSKTYVVLDANPMSEYNFEMRDAIEKYWTLTEYEFIERNDFEENASDETKSFLYLAIVNFEKDKSQTMYNFLCLSIGGDYPTMGEMKDVVNIPVSFYGVDEENFAYKLGTLVNFMQNHVKLIIEDPEMVSQNVFKHYNDNMADIQSKTLYLVKDELERAARTEAAIKAVYPYDFKFVTREDIKDAIMNKEEDVVFLHKVGPEGVRLTARVYKMLIGAGDSHFYYFDYHKITPKAPDAFLLKDLKKLGKARK